MSVVLRLIGLLGITFFGITFAVTYSSPETVEETAKGFVKYQIEKEVREKQEKLSTLGFSDNALSLAGKFGVKSNSIQQKLESDLPEKIAHIIASMCGYDCEREKALATSIRSDYIRQLKNINVAQETLGDIVKGKYVEIVGNLTLDVRIFVASNFVMFLLLLTLSFAKPKAVTHLFLPGILLLLATVISSAVYLFGQNWFYTILYNSYMGFGYLMYIAVIFGGLMDVGFNKARVTTEVINAIANSIGSAFSVLPC